MTSPVRETSPSAPTAGCGFSLQAHQRGHKLIKHTDSLPATKQNKTSTLTGKGHLLPSTTVKNKIGIIELADSLKTIPEGTQVLSKGVVPLITGQTLTDGYFNKIDVNPYLLNIFWLTNILIIS